mgnify:CR=1 FL=1
MFFLIEVLNKISPDPPTPSQILYNMWMVPKAHRIWFLGSRYNARPPDENQGKKSIKLIQKYRAEQEIAVAAASIVARAEFLRRLQDLSSRFAVSLPKGASAQVITAGKTFVKHQGSDALGQVAKLHFRTTQKVFSR